ncbi:DUF3592 domain-containing protein [Angustibacter luteus]|uniref:DUF3592 domain-containing protein n=1 Tax=Angustibacter luteus TaxID=658456 RepID=A0ABW1JF62_9ACTN
MNLAFVQVLAPLLALSFAFGAVLCLRDARRSAVRLRGATMASGVVAEIDRDSARQAACTVGFTTAEGRVVQATSQSASAAHRFEPGQQVNLWYDPQEPTWVVLEGQSSPAGIGAVVGAILALAAVALTLVSVVALI